MKAKKLFIAIVVIIAGFMAQSCDNEVVEVPTTPTETHLVMGLGKYGDGYYQIPEEGITYISKRGVAIYYCETRPSSTGKEIYEEVYSPRFSIGGVADWEVGDTVTWVPMNPNQIAKFDGDVTLIEFIEPIEVVEATQ